MSMIYAASSDHLVVPSVKLSAVGNMAFSVDVSAQSLSATQDSSLSTIFSSHYVLTISRFPDVMTLYITLR